MSATASSTSCHRRQPSLAVVNVGNRVKDKIAKCLDSEIVTKVEAYKVSRDGSMSPVPRDFNFKEHTVVTISQNTAITTDSEGNELSRETTTRVHKNGGLPIPQGGKEESEHEACKRRNVTFAEQATVVGDQQTEAGTLPREQEQSEKDVVSMQQTSPKTTNKPAGNNVSLLKKIAIVFICSIAFILVAIFLKQNKTWLISHIID